METMLPGMPVAARVALYIGLAGGLFAAIVLSYVNADWQYRALVLGIMIGAVTAAVLTFRSRMR